MWPNQVCRAGSDGRPKTPCLHCEEFFTDVYRDLVSCDRLTLHERDYTVCVKQPQNLKGTALNMVYRYLLDGEEFRLDARVSYQQLRYAATCAGCWTTASFRLLIYLIISQSLLQG
jgi:hypothetical protein